MRLIKRSLTVILLVLMICGLCSCKKQGSNILSGGGVIEDVTGINLDTTVFSLSVNNTWHISSEQNLGGIKCLVLLPSSIESIPDINNIDSDTIDGIVICLYSESDMVNSEALVKDKVQIDTKKYDLVPSEPIIDILDKNGLNYYEAVYQMNTKTEPKRELYHFISSGKSATGTFVIEGIASNSERQEQIKEMVDSLQKSSGTKRGIGDTNFVQSLENSAQDTNSDSEKLIDNIKFFKHNDIEYIRYELQNNGDDYQVSAPYFNNLYVADNKNQFMVTNDALSFSIQCELVSKSSDDYIKDIVDQMAESGVETNIKVNNDKFKETDWSYTELEYNLNNKTYNYYIFTKSHNNNNLVYRMDIYTAGLSAQDIGILNYLVEDNIR